VVQKFGGTSVADAERIKRVADRVVAAADRGGRVCVVVSAMGDTTDRLLDLAAEIAPNPHARELDVLLTAGERISMSLLSMAINELGREAVSFTGRQAGIVTDDRHGRARILEVRSGLVEETLAAGKVAIVAGFQGESAEAAVTTLGRGGSDATAVALAAALGAEACEIYTDVEGVFTADPRLVPEARKLDALSFEEMLELAASGAGVLMARSVEYARNHGVVVHVRSSFDDREGTWIGREEELAEHPIISGIAHDTSEAEVTLVAVPDRPGVAATVFRPLADAGINVDMIVQTVSTAGTTDVTFTVPKEDLDRAEPILEAIVRSVGGQGFTTDPEVAKVSLIGAGMKTHPGIAADMFEALADAGINIGIISTSAIRISCVVKASEVQRAVQAVHTRFRLAEPQVSTEAPASSPAE